MESSLTIMLTKKTQIIIGLTRIAMGWIFLWPFIDKLFGLGLSTAPEKAWIDGVSPTYGFLKFATKGPFVDIFNTLAGNIFVDWLFMLGLLGIGMSLILGICMKLSTSSGSLLLILMFLAVLPPEHNPIIDEHIIYVLVLQLLLKVQAGNYLGLSKWWSKTTLVQKYRWLR